MRDTLKRINLVKLCESRSELNLNRMRNFAKGRIKDLTYEEYAIINQYLYSLIKISAE